MTVTQGFSLSDPLFNCKRALLHARLKAHPVAAHWVRMQAEGSDASTPRSFNTASATGHSRTGVARPVPRRRPPPRTPEPLWSLLLFHLRSKLWRALSWLFEVSRILALDCMRIYNLWCCPAAGPTAPVCRLQLHPQSFLSWQCVACSCIQRIFHSSGILPCDNPGCMLH